MRGVREEGSLSITCDGSGLGRVCVASTSLDILYVRKLQTFSNDINAIEYAAIVEADRIRRDNGRPEMGILNDNTAAIETARKNGLRNVRWIERGNLFLSGVVLYKMYVRESSIRTGRTRRLIVTRYNTELDFLNETNEVSMKLSDSKVGEKIMRTLTDGDLRHHLRRAKTSSSVQGNPATG